jgi:hydroxymethylbilane synthase
MCKTVRIGTRESKLAVIQAELVAAAIQKKHPEIKVEYVKIKTTGDKILDRTPDKIGGKGVFVKELDEALRRGDADICVHSYKDVPAENDSDLPIVAVSPREDPRDVLILPNGVKEIDPAKPIGCSSQRRHVQLASLYHGQSIAPVRGNVLTRLEKLDRGEFSALILAAAGIIRLNMQGRVNRFFEPCELLPAGCQGVMAVQGRLGEDYGYLSEYCDNDALDATTAERAFIRRLNCGCGAPVGVLGEICGDSLRLRCMVADDKSNIRRDEISGNRADAFAIGTALAERITAGVAG